MRNNSMAPANSSIIGHQKTFPEISKHANNTGIEKGGGGEVNK